MRRQQAGQSTYCCERANSMCPVSMSTRETQHGQRATGDGCHRHGQKENHGLNHRANQEWMRGHHCARQHRKASRHHVMADEYAQKWKGQNLSAIIENAHLTPWPVGERFINQRCAAVCCSSYHGSGVIAIVVGIPEEPKCGNCNA